MTVNGTVIITRMTLLIILVMQRVTLMALPVTLVAYLCHDLEVHPHASVRIHEVGSPFEQRENAKIARE